MKLKAFLALCLFAVAAMPGGQAQSTSGIAVSFEELAAPLVPGNATDVPFTVSVGCSHFLEAQGDTTITLMTDAAAWLTVSGDTTMVPGAEPALEACLTGTGTYTGSGVLTLTAAPGAPGMAETVLAVDAAVGDATGAGELTFMVDYVPGYTITPDVTFPLMVEGDSVTFNVTIDVTANAITMVMFETVQAASLGSLPTLAPVTLEPSAADGHNHTHGGANPVSQTISVTYTAPVGAWTNETVILKTWSHFLQDGNMKTADELLEWTFMPSETASADSAADKDSPGAAMALVVLGLLGAALVVSRRS